MARKLACLLLVLVGGTSAFAADVGAISGTVKDSTGTPQMGAVVEIFTSAAALGATVFTDSRGFYTAENLAPGTYYVRVSAVSFLPALRENVGLRAGARVLVNVTLNAMASATQALPARRSVATEPDDWHWVLRSSANRPVLRAVDQDNNAGDPASAAAEQTDDHSLKARVAFFAGSEAGGFGSAGDMTTAFALEKSLFGSGTFSFDGNIGASSGDPAGVLRASYSQDFGTSQHPVFALIYRRFAAPGTFVGNSPVAAVELNSSDRMTVGDFVELQYGAAIQSMEFAKRITALRPYGAVTVHLTPSFVVEYRYSTSEPNTRAAKGFDTAPADLSESGPRMALANGEPNIEQAQHQEVSVSRRFGKTSLQVACYLDHVRNAVLTGAGDPSAYSDDVLPDIYSGTFSYAFAGALNTTGARVVLERKILDDLAATLDYSSGGAVTAESVPGTWQNLAQTLVTRRQQSLGAKLAGYVPASGTRWIASYKWTSGNTVSVVDAFNASPGQTDPYLSLFIRQPLPATSLIPAKMDALVDLRNLLAQGYLPVMGPDGRLVYLVQSARSLRGGVAFTF
ncbi:MAG TPA: carboxypeptidase-like regulatory domain-containing protein [Candidatus Angelobacter sp.]|nr:carboxypeptidase-like regulatory domain-containing protein [Candidatus Angelobacter sp.]